MNGAHIRWDGVDIFDIINTNRVKNYIQEYYFLPDGYELPYLRTRRESLFVGYIKDGFCVKPRIAPDYIGPNNKIPPGDYVVFQKNGFRMGTRFSADVIEQMERHKISSGKAKLMLWLIYAPNRMR